MLRFLLTIFLMSFISINAYSALEKCAQDGQTPYDKDTQYCHCTRTVNNGSETYTCEPKSLPGVADKKKECDDAKKVVADSLKKDSDFRKACQKVTSATDAKTCIQAADKCKLCIGTAEDEELDASCQDGDSDDDSSDDINGVNGLSEIIAAAQGRQPRSGEIISKGKVRLMKQRFNNCPVYSKDEFEDIVKAREQHEEGKKEARELLEEKVAELKTAQRELGDLQKEQAKLPQEYQEAFDKIVAEQTQKLQDQLKQNGEQLVELILNLQTAEMQFVDAKNAIYKICFDKAQAALDRVKAERSRKIQAGELRSKGGFTGLAKQTSTEDRLERYAKAVQKRCERKNSEVKKQIRSAEKVYDQTIKRLNLQIQKLESQQRDIANKLMDAVEDPEEKERLDKLRKDFEKRIEDVGKQIAEKLELIENLQTIISRVQDELQKHEIYYAHYLEQEQKIESKGTPDDDAQTRGEFLKSINEYQWALYEAHEACGCATTSLTGAYKDESSCRRLETQMNQYFGDGEADGSGVTRVRESADQ